MKMPKQTPKILFFSGGLFTIIGSVAQLFDFKSAPWIFSVGSVFLVYVHLINYLDKKDVSVTQQRLARVSLFSSLLLFLAAYFMFTASNLWVLAVLIYALSSLYLSFRTE